MNKPSEVQNDLKFQNKYRISSTRLKGYDYLSNGAYFITICTKNRENFFGEIRDGEIRLSKIGEIAADEWKESAEIRKYVYLGEWVVMPNHLHGILILDNAEYTNDGKCRDVLPKRLYKTKRFYGHDGDHHGYDGDHPQMSKISPAKNSLSTIIRFFKRQTTIRARQITPDFAWQPRFHDRIIRNEPEHQRIAEYIYNNPVNWERDDYFLNR